jgi:hypothetical protein
MSRIEDLGDDHAVQKGELDPGPLVVAVRPWLERSWRQRLIEFRPFRPDFRGKLDDLQLGADRLSASATNMRNGKRR